MAEEGLATSIAASPSSAVANDAGAGILSLPPPTAFAMPLPDPIVLALDFLAIHGTCGSTPVLTMCDKSGGSSGNPLRLVASRCPAPAWVSATVETQAALRAQAQRFFSAGGEREVPTLSSAVAFDGRSIFGKALQLRSLAAAVGQGRPSSVATDPSAAASAAFAPIPIEQQQPPQWDDEKAAASLVVLNPMKAAQDSMSSAHPTSLAASRSLDGLDDEGTVDDADVLPLHRQAALAVAGVGAVKHHSHERPAAAMARSMKASFRGRALDAMTVLKRHKSRSGLRQVQLLPGSGSGEW